jgi:hypothetical protein
MLASCSVFAAAGAASRLIFVAVETRLQILAFCGASLAVHFAPESPFRRVPGGVVRFAFVWNAAAATVAIVATRVALEGWPHRLLSLVGSM